MDKPVPALPSATVVLLREHEGPPELLMVKRRAGDAFGDSYAFPGGVVDHDESDAHGRIDGKTADEANAILGVFHDGLDYYSAAIRELFEETGILLARTDDGEWATVTEEMEKLRIEVDKGRMRWSAFLEQQGLRLACDALHYFAHWETPLVAPKRWSTRFFLAQTPAAQDATYDGTEVTDICWLTASEALAGKREGSMKLPFPTTRNLVDMSALQTIDEIIDWADSRVDNGITRLCPVRVKQGVGSKWTVWGDPEYPHGEPL
jgi:8-oxo-dGTP pyrophosphatase MutT (NUDIX family)